MYVKKRRCREMLPIRRECIKGWALGTTGATPLIRGRQNFQLPAGAAFAAWKGYYKRENPLDKART